MTRVWRQPLGGGVLVAWALDTGPDTAGYLIYRAGSPDVLADLRYFGQPGPGGVTDPARLARLNYLAKAWPAPAFPTGLNDRFSVRRFVSRPTSSPTRSLTMPVL